jgi:hypothetical protein
MMMTMNYGSIQTVTQAATDDEGEAEEEEEEESMEMTRNHGKN